MAVRRILRMGDPVLARIAAPIDDPTASAVAALIADMRDSMRAAGGVGLAAPQIGESVRLVIFAVPAARTGDDPDDRPLGLQVLINPRIEPLDEAMTLGWEGCLSLPGLRGEVPRHRRIRYTGLDEGGGLVDRIASGFHARVVQHEIDHLDGILYPQRMTDMRRFGFVEALAGSSRAGASGAGTGGDG